SSRAPNNLLIIADDFAHTALICLAQELRTGSSGGEGERLPKHVGVGAFSVGCGSCHAAEAVWSLVQTRRRAASARGCARHCRADNAHELRGWSRVSGAGHAGAEGLSARATRERA